LRDRQWQVTELSGDRVRVLPGQGLYLTLMRSAYLRPVGGASASALRST